jgi:hypothetical protein
VSRKGSECTNRHQNELVSPPTWYTAHFAPAQMTSAQTASGTPSRMSRSRANSRGPLRATEPGVTSPEMRKKRPITKRTAGRASSDNTALLTAPSWTSWTSW